MTRLIAGELTMVATTPNIAPKSSRIAQRSMGKPKARGLSRKRMPRVYKPLPVIQETVVQPNHQQLYNQVKTVQQASKNNISTAITSTSKTIQPRAPTLKYEPYDALTNLNPRGSPRYALKKSLTLLAADGHIMKFNPGHGVKLVKQNRGGQCKIVTLWDRRVVLEVEVWRDFLSEEPLWASRTSRVKMMAKEVGEAILAWFGLIRDESV